jgi:putative cell wall-binding protein
MANIFKSFDDENIKNITNSEQFKKASKDKNVQDFINNNQFVEFKEKYKNKSDDEILKDAKEFSQKLKEQYGEKEYNKKIQDLKNFEKFLNPEQRKKMKKFLDNLK